MIYSCYGRKEKKERDSFLNSCENYVESVLQNFIVSQTHKKKLQCVSDACVHACVEYVEIQRGKLLHRIVIITSSVSHRSIFQVYFRSHSYRFRLCTFFHITAGFFVKRNFMAGWWGSVVSEDECCVCTWFLGRRQMFSVEMHCRSSWVYERNTDD